MSKSGGDIAEDAIKRLSKENAQALWDWRGPEEIREHKEEIKDCYKRLQRMAGRGSSPKGLPKGGVEKMKTLIQHISYLEQALELGKSVKRRALT